MCSWGHSYKLEPNKKYTWEEWWDTLNKNELSFIKEGHINKERMEDNDLRSSDWECKIICLRAFSYWRNNHSH
jgi:hypothetical protein